MNSEVNHVLVDEVEAEIEYLSTIGVGSEEQKAAVDSIVKLYGLILEDEKQSHDIQLQEKEKSDKHDKDKQESIFNRIKLAAEVAMFATEMLVISYWTRRGFIFEEEGSFTSSTLRNLFKNRPKINR